VVSRSSPASNFVVMDLVGAAGIEPATLGLEIRCSIRLSYAPTVINTGQNAECLELRPCLPLFVPHHQVASSPRSRERQTA
jgi:hypothetical protein